MKNEEIAEKIVNDWLAALVVETSAIESDSKAKSAITAALNAKDRDHGINGQCMMEERDNAVTELYRAIEECRRVKAGAHAQERLLEASNDIFRARK